jgi:hypothetical protein
LREDEHDDLLASLVAGWAERLATTIAQVRAGQGRVLICTFTLLPFLTQDPVATVMLHDLVDYVTSSASDPRKRLP